MRSAAEAVAYAKALHSLVTWLDICDGNMAEGSFRVDANVSVHPKGQAEFGTRREIKNLNSFRFLEQAINYEVEAQIEILEDGGKVQQATMLFDPEKGETRVMRLKEDAHDSRYFPDPDLLPVIISDDRLQKAKAENEEQLKGARLELIQLTEQGDQVVKSPWSSWQFGMNYMYEHWGAPYKGRGDKASKYPFVGVYNRGNWADTGILSNRRKSYMTSSLSTSTIGSGAFGWNPKLQEVTLPSTLTEQGSGTSERLPTNTGWILPSLRARNWIRPGIRYSSRPEIQMPSMRS